MFERDHIMRQVNQLAQALSRAMGLRAEEQYLEAVSEIDQAIGLVVDPEVLSKSEAEISRRLADPDDPLSLHAPELAALLEQKAEAQADEGLHGKADESRKTALTIYKVILESGRSILPWDIRERIARLEDLVGPHA